jgi:Zinc finger, C2H2 type
MLSSSRKSRDSNALKCDFPGCHSRATFKRKYELQRHMKKHERKETYPCPAIDCDRKGSRSFYRVDKFAHHLRTGHGDNDSYLCPLAECLTHPMSFDEIKLHARGHGWKCNSIVQTLRRIPARQRQCMLKNCLKKLDIFEMQSHLLDHTMNERLEEVAVIQQMGYDAETVKVICPLCELLLGNHGEFAAHLQSVHLTTDSAHLAKFQESVANIIPVYEFQRDVIWSPWGARHVPKNTVCPTCGQPASTRVDRIDHHLQLLPDQNEVRPYRWDIFRLCPNFGTHPVFDDVRPSILKHDFPWV